MVFTYTGKLDFSPYAHNSIITVVVPDSIRDNHTCLIYWQWEVDAAGVKNHNMHFHGQFKDLVNQEVQVKDRYTSSAYYWFIWHLDTQILQMKNPANDKCGKPTKLTLLYKVRYSYWLAA